MRRGSWCEVREELPELVSHTPAPLRLRPRGHLKPPAPTGSCAVYHYPEEKDNEREERGWGQLVPTLKVH